MHPNTELSQSAKGWSVSKWQGLFFLLGGMLVPLLLSGYWVLIDELPAFWDRRSYLTLVRAVSAAFDASLLSGVKFLWGITGQDYNGYFAVPLLPFLEGQATRLDSYLGSMLFAYVPLFIGACFLLIREVSRGRTAADQYVWPMLSAVPLAWTVTLGGLPDALPSAALVFAWICLLKFLSRPRWSLIATGAVLLAGSMALRRHFAYPALVTVAVFAGMVVQANVVATRRIFPSLVKGGLAGGCVGAGALIALALMVPEFVGKALRTDHIGAYASYAAPVADVTHYALILGGWVLLLVGASGWWLLWRKQQGNRSGIVFIGLVLAGWLAIWLLRVRYVNIHYFFTIWTVFVAVGISGYSRALLGLRSWPRFLAALGLYVLLLATLVFSLFPQQSGRSKFDVAPLGLSIWPLAYAPTEDQTAAYAALTDCLSQEMSASSGQVMVVASSTALNRDILESVSEEHPSSRKIDFLVVPEVDSRDGSPLSAMVKADALIVAQPFQHHLDPSQQKVMQVPHDALLSQGPLKRFYRPVCESRLPGGIQATAFVRDGGLSGGLLSQLVGVAAKTGKPGDRWIVEQDGFEWASVQPESDSVTLFGNAGTSTRPTIFTSTTQVHAGREVRIEAEVKLLNSACPGVWIVPSLLPVGGGAGEAFPATKIWPGSTRLQTIVPVASDAYLQLRVHTGSPEQSSMAGCGVRFSPVVSERASSGTVAKGVPVTRPIAGPAEIRATYGSNCTGSRDPGKVAGNATSDVVSVCANAGEAACRYTVMVGAIGDPAIGCAKDFSVSWRCGDEARHAYLPPEAHGQSLEISCSR